MQTELLDRHRWTSRRQLAAALFDYIERLYNPTRRHSRLGYPSPVDDETALSARRLTAA